jgi:hypothetical protein
MTGSNTTNGVEWKTKDKVKAEIDKVVYMLGLEPTDDIDQLRSIKDNKLKKLIRRYDSINS